jgi:hypothetical protein
MLASLALTIGCTIVFVSTLLWPAEYLLRRLQGGPARTPETGEKPYSRWLAGIASLFFLALIVALAVTPHAAGQPLFSSAGILEPVFVVLLFFARLAIVLTVGVIAYTVLAWHDRSWSLWRRVHYTLVAAALVAFTIWLAFFTLAGFGF